VYQYLPIWRTKLIPGDKISAARGVHSFYHFQDDAMTLSITTFGIMALNISVFATLSINDTQHKQYSA